MIDTVKTSWFPGHMAKGFAAFKKEIKKAQVVIEVLDARIPISSRNKDIFKLTEGKKKIVVLNKLDLVPRKAIRKWEAMLSEREGAVVISTNLATDASSSKKVMACLNSIQKNITESKAGRGLMQALLKIVIIGIPNVGKSTLINRLVGKNRVRVGKRPGITLGPQWISFGNNFELLDMPGILEPNLENAHITNKLSMTYAVSDRATDPVVIAGSLIDNLKKIYKENEPDNTYPLFKEIDKHATSHETLSALALFFNFLQKDGCADVYRVACKLLKDYRDGVLGKFILDVIKN
ncbi:MAG: ribosome biogenesis GTPase YlqF [Candidatus Wallbacteria bacterium]